MKKLMAVLLLFCLTLIPALVLAEEDYDTETEKEKEKPKLHCPTTLITDQHMCMDCHVMSGREFRLKEFPLDAHIEYPAQTRIMDFGKENPIGIYELYGGVTVTDYDNLYTAMKIFKENKVSHVIMEIYSYGGDLFAAWRLKGLIDDWIAEGNSFDTKVYGAAMSAAAILFAAGQERTVHTQAELMLHELATFTFFEVSTPANTEEKARVLRHLQDTISEWLATRCHKTKDELDALMRQKEYWLRGKEAYEIGLATKLIGG